MDLLYAQKKSFFFLIDFWAKNPEIVLLEDLSAKEIFFAIEEKSNFPYSKPVNKPLVWEKYPLSEAEYSNQFTQVKKALKVGNTYLLNLTCTTPIKTNYTLLELFASGIAKYKLYYKDIFTHFSPEPFIRIEDGHIASFPMKGTIDGSVEEAEKTILANEKELQEQYTIVDLIRNDLSMVAHKVRVEDFRYIEKIKTPQKDLLAVSTKIGGELRPNYIHKPGSVFSKLLPAGSICGAPKTKTVALIDAIETHNRNYYTGVWGICTPQKIDSCVIIRYTEKTKEGLVFKSGGGITAKSESSAEYQEMIDKIYVPIA